jgi:predicted ATPase
MAASELGPGGENLLRVLGSSEKYGVGRRTLVQLLRPWLSERFRMVKNLDLVDLAEGGTIRSLVADEMAGFKGINVAAMGEGLSQIMTTMAGVLMSSSGECLLIEQPEIHLHPAAQADLGDLFIETVETNKAQVIVETHSEHLLLRIRRRVAEGKIRPEQLAILYVEKVKGESRVRHLELNGRGHFDEWPEGFFEEGYREALAIAEASSGDPQP